MLTCAKQDKRKRLEASILAFLANKSIFYYPSYNKKETKKSNNNSQKDHSSIQHTWKQKPNERFTLKFPDDGADCTVSTDDTNWGEWLIHQWLYCHPEGPPQAEEMGWHAPHQQHSITQTATKKDALSRLCCGGENILLSSVQKQRNNKSPCNLLF